MDEPKPIREKIWWKGEVPGTEFRTKSDLGLPADPNTAVFPILTQDDDGMFKLIGTGFFIGTQGLFVTAKHVVEAVLDSEGLPIRPFGMCQILSDNTYYMRAIRLAVRHRQADVAVGFAWPMHHNLSKAPLLNTALPLSSRRAAVGEKVVTYAFPKCAFERDGRRQNIFLEPGFFDGVIAEEFPQGRDSAVLPGPCFRTSMVVHGGASGGPVIDEQGEVCGINSTGFMNDNISFISCISSVLDLDLPNFQESAEHKPRTIKVRELAGLKVITLN